MAMNYFYQDLYPNMASPTLESSLLLAPEKDDQEALAENDKVSDEASNTESRRGMIWLAVGLIVAMVILFGAGGK